MTHTADGTATGPRGRDAAGAHPGGAPFPRPLIDELLARPGAPAFEFRGREVTRAELLGLIRRCAGGLRAAGLGPGRTVALATGVTPAGFAAQMAALLLGCRVIGLRPGLTPGQLAHVLGGEVDAVVTDDADARPGLRAAAAGRPLLGLDTGLLSAAPLPEAELVPRGRPEDIALVNLTSGSTGNPKGCAQTFRSLDANWSWQPARWTARTAELAANYGRFLLFGTLTSAVMFEHLAVCLLGGGTAVIPEEPLDFPEVFARQRITACLLTVPRLHHVLDTLRRRPVDTGSLRVLIVSGSPLTPHRMAEAVERLGGAVHQGYGQTETGMLTLLTPAELAAGPREVRSSVGRPWVGVELSVRDRAGNPLPAGQTGIVWARTEGAFSGYLGDAGQTAEVLREGWVCTRDVGRLDERGYLYLTGRARDVIIINAIVHYAGAIEGALAGHGDVDAAYVVGAPDERTGEAAHAFVVPAAGRAPDVAALRAHVAAELGEGSVPATITLLDEVPVAPSGKPDKRALLARVRPARA
ncbi:class I adenylate-forming enzyme family protein [Streptomyces hoynatensis]|uniref:Long-chain fatty acid--CoA ligase n=1 Tax=Streptomyces hoynatensis TaxID=1141874 RepID=A0A3A9Z003_9ACTN|nr:long-chain fatty acid--CoA ligase [Streptomyces hoynatensis]RKN41319.1 long-chain fatty acid--CoA ligase [Streptomyces hoynatensis]